MVQVGESKVHFVSYNILARNENPLEDFPKRFLFCHENNQLLKCMLGQGAQAPSIEVQRFVQSAFSMANFFLKYFAHKNWRGGGKLMNCY